jgi:putative Mn2+ efflux pump MntP
MSADACAAAMARGASTKPRLSSAIRSGLVFGMIEALTPFLGRAAGRAASGFIAAIDHWVAFILLGIVGGKMAIESVVRLGASRQAG